MNWNHRRQIHYAIRRALALRCPACGYGRLYAGGLRLCETCDYCHARYEREPGESLGVTYLVSGLTLILVLGGFWLIDVVLDSDPAPYLAVWIGIVIAGNLLFYRFARALWIAFAYLTGGVYPDPDYEREYIAPGQKSPHYER
ncbi:MAG: DUF983 domain-containing protein [Anaerolineae bacterium]|nr:DUF983 domain-containing protein [Anaerolineae bacterium]